MHATKTGKGAFSSSLFFQNSEHRRIGYFGYEKLSFDRLNVFFLGRLYFTENRLRNAKSRITVTENITL